MKVCVVGAGVVGCAAAYQLVRDGHQVTLVDAAPVPGSGTSLANGGQLSYSYVEPLASPATLRSLPRMLLSSDSALRLSLQLDWRQWTWGLQFLAACTSRQVARGTRALLDIAALSRATLDRWMQEESLDFDFKRNGKLVLCEDQESLANKAAQVRLQAHQGVEQHILGWSECVDQEPALDSYRGFAGGIWTPSECAGDPHLFCQSLVAAAKKTARLRCVFGASVKRFVIDGKTALAIETGQEILEADAFVLATGVRAPVLARQLGERPAIYPIKGYSVTLPFKAKPPLVSVTDLSQKMVLAPLNGQLRVAAMAEMTGHKLSIAPSTVARITRGVEKIYPGLCDLRDPHPWTGLRPATPTSVPIIRRSAVGNVVLNIGHGALGFTLAAGSASLVAALIAQLPD